MNYPTVPVLTSRETNFSSEITQFLWTNTDNNDEPPSKSDAKKNTEADEVEKYSYNKMN